MSLLPTYIERRVSNPFSNLRPDEQVVAHWALIYKELLKYNYSSFIGYDLDNIATEKQMNNLTSDKKGGVIWYNYMYSDRYKDDEKLKQDNILVGGKDPNYWARLTVFEALERFAKCVNGWEDCVMIMGFWYEKNIHTYQLGNSNPAGGPCNLFPEPYQNHTIRDDCTGYVCACILFYAATILYKQDKNLVEDIFKGFSWPPSSEIWSTKDSAAQKTTELAGFEIITYDPLQLQPFDIVMGNMKNGRCKGHHGEIYAGTFNGKKRSWGWGGVHDESKGGMPAGFVNYDYDYIFRLKGIKKYTDKEAEDLIKVTRGSASIPDGSAFYSGKKIGNNNTDTSQKANG